MPRGRFDLGQLALILASAIGLGGCEALFFDPDDQPPFAVRNAFDMTVEPPIGIPFLDVFDEQIPLRTIPLMREAFPQGTSLDYIAGYFTGIGGSCRRHGAGLVEMTCEYCTLKTERVLDYFTVVTRRHEILWHIEILDRPSVESNGASSNKAEAVSLTVLGGEAPTPDSEADDNAPTLRCDSARRQLKSSSRLFQARKWWIYGEPKPKEQSKNLGG